MVKLWESPSFDALVVGFGVFGAGKVVV